MSLKRHHAVTADLQTPSITTCLGVAMGMGFGAGCEPENGVNESNNPTMEEVDAGRRHVLKSATAAVALLVGSHSVQAATPHAKYLGFTSVPVSVLDT